MKNSVRHAQLIALLEIFRKSEFTYLCLSADEISEEFLEFVQKELLKQGYPLDGTAFDTPLNYPNEDSHIYRKKRILWIESMIEKYSN